MKESKAPAVSAITRAQAALAEALDALDKMPAFDRSSVGFHAHALNNYLAVAGGLIELILTEQPSHLDKQVKEWLEDVLLATHSMGRTVSHLMTASGDSDVELHFDKVDDLPSVIARICGYYERVAQRKTIRLSFSSTADVPPVWTDRVAIAAVLDNLLSNAVKYSEPGKQVWVEVGGENGWAVCSVRDEGPGLSQQDQLKLFQRGERLTPRPTGGEASTGYGLAVAKELVEKMGGELWCKSTLGQGSCFTCRLPSFREHNPGTDPTTI